MSGKGYSVILERNLFASCFVHYYLFSSSSKKANSLTNKNVLLSLTTSLLPLPPLRLSLYWLVFPFTVEMSHFFSPHLFFSLTIPTQSCQGGILFFVLSAVSSIAQERALKNMCSSLAPNALVFFRDYARGDLAQFRSVSSN